MLDDVSFVMEVNHLIRSGQIRLAEKRMLEAYSALKGTTNKDELENVVAQLAHFYSMPETEDQVKAEAYFLERERLSPAAYPKLQTATFYFYVVRDFRKTISKVDEIDASLKVDKSVYYSALTLKGHALINLDKLDRACQVLEELLTMIKAASPGLPFGDELNFVEAARVHESLAPLSREILRQIIPKIRSPEYLERAKSLLKSA